MRVPCDVELDDVSRFALGMYVGDAAHDLAFVVYCAQKDREEAAAAVTR